jgi:hypothetical protein
MMTLTVFLALQQTPQPNGENYGQRLAILLERIDRLVEDASKELWQTGALSDQKVKLGDTIFNQMSYAFKIVFEDYIHGKTPWTDELERSQALLKDLVKAKEVEGGWLAKAASRRIIPRIRAGLSSVTLAAPWDPCDGLEKACLTCQVRQRMK